MIKNQTIAFALIIGLFSASCSQSNTNNEASNADAESRNIQTESSNAGANAEEEVANAVEVLREAMISGDEEQLQQIASDKLSYGHSSGKIEGKDSFVESLVSKKSDFVTIELLDQTIEVTGNTAIVRHRLTGTTNDGGTAGTVNLGIMLVWQNEGGDWKLLGRQAFKL